MYQCSSVKSNNIKCRANRVKDSDFCFRHDPSKRLLQGLASKKGGQNRALQGAYGEEINISSPQEVRDFIGVVINGVWTGKVPVPVGTSMGFLAKCWLEAHSASEIQKRLENIEERLDVNESN